MQATIRFSKGDQSYLFSTDNEEILIDEIMDNDLDGWKATQIVKPEKNCQFCHGSGTIYQYHDAGSPEPLNCSCLESQLLDIDGLEFEVDLR